MTAATAALAAWQRQHEGGSLTAAEEKEGKDLKDRLQTLKDLDEKREDLGALSAAFEGRDARQSCPLRAH